MEIITLDKLNLIDYDDFQKVTHDNGSKSATVNVSYNGDIDPVLITLETVLRDEQVHVLSTRAYIDILLNDIQVEYLQDFDDRNIESVISNSERWFGQSFPEHIVREYYQPILNKKKKTGEYFCRFKINTSINLPSFTLVTKYVDSLTQRVVKTAETQLTDLDQLHCETITIYITHRGLQFGKKSFVCDMQFYKIEVIEYISSSIPTNVCQNKQQPAVLNLELQQSTINESNISVVDQPQHVSLLVEKQDIECELSEFSFNDLDKFVVHENISVRHPSPTCFYDFVETEKTENINSDAPMEYNQTRKNKLLSRQSKYLQALQDLKIAVENEVEIALRKQNALSEKYMEAMQYYQTIEQQDYFDPDDELLEEEILEKNGRLTPVFSFEEELDFS